MRTIRWAELGDQERAGVKLRDPATLARYIDDEWLVPVHVRLMADTIARAVRAGNGRIILEMPPRHSKSETGSHWSPVWFLESFPKLRVAVTSYAHDKAIEWGQSVRDTFRDNPSKLLTRLSADTTAKATWKTSDGGGMRCVGVGGPLTGFGFDLGVCDDPLKDDIEAQSEVYRERAWQWWTKVFLTRAQPGATIILIGTRWHEDDLIGRVKRQQADLAEAGEDHDEWTVIKFPCIAEDHDDLGRKPGEALWPDFGFDERWASKQRSAVGPWAWAALYQQRPSPAGGGQFQSKHFRYWSKNEAGGYTLHHGDGNDEDVHPGSTWKLQTVDTAIKIKQQNDWTCVLTCAITARCEVIILDLHRERLEVPDQLPLIKRLRNQWRPRWTGVEEKASGAGLIQEARRQGVVLKPIKAEVSKEQRAQAAAILYAQHAIFHPLNAPWVADYEVELLAFPNGTFDDQVDVIAHAANELGSGPSMLTAGKSRKRETVTSTGMAEGDVRW